MPFFKFLIKLLLSCLPQRKLKMLFGVFKHGDMDDLVYAESVVAHHFGLIAEKQNIRVLELGPGEALSTGIVLAEKYPNMSIDYLDVSDFAAESNYLYAEHLEKCGENQGNESALVRFLQVSHSRYFTNGLEDLRKLENDSYDFIFSHAVMEHIYKDEIKEYIQNTHRILRNGGMISHQIDFRDHLGGRNFNLKFPNKLWESERIKNAGFYTNRISPSRMTRDFVEAGFVDVTIADETRYLKREKNNSAGVLGWTDDDINIESYLLTAKK